MRAPAGELAPKSVERVAQLERELPGKDFGDRVVRPVEGASASGETGELGRVAVAEAVGHRLEGLHPALVAGLANVLEGAFNKTGRHEGGRVDLG